MTKELSPLTRSENDRRELIDWAVACAERALPLFEETSLGDRRPREALTGAMAFAKGELRTGAVRQLAVACHAAAREASRHSSPSQPGNLPTRVSSAWVRGGGRPASRGRP